MVRAGRIVTGIAGFLLLLDAYGKVIEVAPVVEGTIRLGYPPHLIFVMGAMEAACTVAYLIPRSSVFGAILLTGYLGGAVATHLRIGDPVLTHIFSPIYMAILIWAGLLLRENRLRPLIPIRRATWRSSSTSS